MYKLIDKSEKFYNLICVDTPALYNIEQYLLKLPDRNRQIDLQTWEIYKSNMNREYIVQNLEPYLIKNEVWYELFNIIQNRIVENEIQSEDLIVKPNEYKFKTQPWKHQLNTFLKTCLKKRYAYYFEQRTGKALTLDTKILTTNGWKQCKDITKNDILFDMYGKETHIQNIFCHDKLEIYEITFIDGTKIKCCKDHLWYYQTRRDRLINRLKVGTIQDMLKKWNGELKKTTEGGKQVNSIYRFNIPLCKNIQFKEQKLPIHPYVLASLICDGGLSQIDNNSILFYTKKDKDVINKFNKYCQLSIFSCNKNNINNISYYIKKSENRIIYDTIKKFNLNVTSDKKYIPDIYKYNSFKNRFKLLCGLIDGDGCIEGSSKKGNSRRFTYTTVSKQLALDVQEIVNSLGGRVISLKERQGRYKKDNFYIYTKIVYSLRFSFNNNMLKLFKKFLCPRHSKKILQIKPIKLSIKNIKYIGIDSGRCFEVDSPTSSFIIENYIVTHNTKICYDVSSFLFQNKKIDTLLVIAPNLVHKDWITEAAPEHCSVEYNGIAWNSKKKITIEELDKTFNNDKLNIFSINRESIITIKGEELLEHIVKKYKCMLVVDECHHLKTVNGKQQGMAKVLAKHCPYVRILSGTPIGNKGLIDLYAQFQILDNNILGTGTVTAFRRLCENYPERAKNYFIEHTKGFMERLRMRDCFNDFPDIGEIIYKFDMNPEQKKIYQQIKENNFIMDDKDVTLFRNIIIKLQQVVSGYYVDTEGVIKQIVDWKNNPKIKLLAEQIELVDGKLLIWTKFKQEVKDICDYLNTTDYKYVVYTGDQNQIEKDTNKRLFKEKDDIKIMVLNLLSGNEGITLFQAHTSIYYSTSFSFIMDQQSQFRIIKGGDKTKKTIIRLGAVNTIDTRIFYLLKQKEKLSKEIIDNEKCNEIEDLKYILEE